MNKFLLSIVFKVICFTPLNIFGQSLNLSFEDIETRNNSTHKVVYWSPLSPTFGGEIVSDSYEGRNAIKIWTWYFYTEGKFKLGNDGKGMSFEKRPLRLKGFYKYNLGNSRSKNDSALVNVFLTKFNHANFYSDTLGSGKYLFSRKDSFAEFTVPIKYFSNATPDTLKIDFLSHIKKDSIDKNGNPQFGWCIDSLGRCHYLIIDNLSLDYSTTYLVEALKSPITIHPNPTSNNVNITWGENAVSDVLLKDILGRTLQKKAVNTEGVELDLSTLPTGVYFVDFKQNGQHLATRKVVKQ
jgi:hypothetical protein